MSSREQQQQQQQQRQPQNGHHHHHIPPPPPPSFQNGHHHNRNHDHHHRRRPYYSSSSYTSSPSSSASLKGCCCCIFLLLAFLALLAVAVVLIVVLAVKPKKPQFDLQQVGVQYMGIDPSIPASDSAAATATASASLSLNIHLLFNAVNPNKVGIKYGESKFTVMYRGIPLGKASVPPFYQEPHSVRQVEATIVVDRVSLMQADAATYLVRDASLNDRVELRIFGDIGAKIRVLEFDSPGVQVSVDCAIVISPRKQSLTYKQCGIDGVNL